MTRPEARMFATSLDLLDPELHASLVAFAELRRLGAEAPVAWCPGRRGPGYWSITGHAELLAAARDAATFSSYWGTRPEVTRPAEAVRPLHNLDPPEHGALRAIAARAVGAERLDALAPALDAILDSTLDALVSRADVELVRDLAEPILARVFAAWLGLPPARAPELLAHVVEVHRAGAALLDVGAGDPARPALALEARAATERIARFLADALAAAAPDSVLGELAAAAPQQAVGLATLFVEAGLPTLIDTLASALVDVLEHPGSCSETARPASETRRTASETARPASETPHAASETAQTASETARAASIEVARPDEGARATLVQGGRTATDDARSTRVQIARTVADDDAPPTLVEELLRRASPIAQFARRARHETTLGGQRIAAGDQVVLWFVAANHDARVFAEPERLVATRSPNPHVAFGIGPHRCIGAAFARLVLRRVLRAWGSVRVELVGPAVRRRSSYQRGFERLPAYVAR